MAEKYAENPLYKKAVDTSYKVGKIASASRAAKASREIDTSKYQNIAGAMPQVQAQSTEPIKGNVMERLKGLGSISTQYGSSTSYEKFHPAIDVANRMGTPLSAFTGGTVTEVVGGKKQDPSKPSFGNYVIITDQYGNKNRYSHLHQSFVKVGQKVAPGARIGTMGNTGSTYSQSGGDASHLDYRIQDAYGKYINPMVYLSKFMS